MPRGRQIDLSSPPGPYQCEFCPATLASKNQREALEWRWATGYREATAHCCPACRQAHAAAWRDLVAQSRQRPGSMCV